MLVPSVIRQAPPASPDIVVVWRAIELCALACRFCGYSRSLRRPRLATDLSAAIAFVKVLGDVQQQSGRSILVSWLGGEPLDWAELPHLAQIFHRNFGLRLGVTTNGVPLVSPAVRESLLADYEQITVSVDGLPPFHDQVRGMPGLYDRLRAGVSRLCAEDVGGRLWRRVNTVLMRGNIGEFGPFCEEMAAWGFHELTFNQLGGNDRPEFYLANRLLSEQVASFARALPVIRRRMADRGMIVRGNQRYLARIAATTGGRQIAIDDCRPGTEFLFIDALGRISPCSFSSEHYGIPVTQIDSAEAFLELPRHFRQMRWRNRLTACDDCHATHVFDKFTSAAELDVAIAK